MTVVLIVIVLAGAALLTWLLAERRHGRASAGVALNGRPAGPRPRAGEREPGGGGGGRILFPFVARGLSSHALNAALRLARSEGATLVPVFLARVSLDLPLDTPIPRQAELALPLQEAIEQRAGRYGVPVDPRIERGRSHRHALRRAIAAERFDRIVVAAAGLDDPGFKADDVAWLLGHAPGEIVVLRPAAGDRADRLGPAAAAPATGAGAPAGAAAERRVSVGGPA